MRRTARFFGENDCGGIHSCWIEFGLMADDFNLETRFSRSRGLFSYIALALGLGLLVLVVMVVSGKFDYLPYSEYFAVRAPAAADGTEALALLSLDEKEDQKTVTISGTLMNRTESPISGLVAVITVTDNFTLPVQTVNVPVEPAELDPKATGMFQTTVTVGETGFGGYSIDFRLPNDGPFVPHKDERPADPTISIEEKPR